jgi:hypothetical protein
MANDRSSPALTAALDYLARGFSVVPQRAGDKKPCVRWKDYQGRLPTREELIEWLTGPFPDAGLAVVLGPVSNLFVIDVDGPEAHSALLDRLGSEPLAPKVLSGSGKPSRYHLFFQHPAVATRAKSTPWHPQLEFRGNKGIVVPPPSLHRSGQRYQWAEGRSLKDVALPELPGPVLEALSERAGRDVARRQQGERPVIDIDDLPGVLARARAYLVTLPAAIEGQGGDRQTFTAACHLVLGFALTPAQALPLLLEYNQRCRPPWKEDELAHKLQEADRRTEPRGTLLDAPGAHEPAGEKGRAAHDSSGEGHPKGQAFVGTLPDFVLADWAWAMPRRGVRDSKGRRKPGRTHIGGGFHWAIRLAVLSQRSAHVVVPDVLLGQVFWGGEKSRWPANWRRDLLRRLQLFSGGPQSPFVEVHAEKKGSSDACPECCALHGTAIAHSHFWILIRCQHDIEEADKLEDEGRPDEDAWLSHVFLGVLELYGITMLEGQRVYDFTLKRQRAEMKEEAFKALAAKLRGFRSQGRLVSVYLPLRLFGGSARLGLSFQQRQLLLALHRELTRDGKSTRPDKAHVFIAGRLASGTKGAAIDHYPGLQKGHRYVGFNGNAGGKQMHYWGRGYRIFGDKSNSIL